MNYLTPEFLERKAYPGLYFIFHSQDAALRVLTKTVELAGTMGIRLKDGDRARRRIKDLGKHKVVLSDEELFQLLSYRVSEGLEVEIEKKHFGYTGGVSRQGHPWLDFSMPHFPRPIEEADMVIRYVLSLLRATIFKNPIKVCFGVLQCLYDYRNDDPYSVLKTIDPSYAEKHPPNHNIHRPDIHSSLRNRFGLLLTEVNKPNERPIFESREAGRKDMEFIRLCLMELNFWGHQCHSESAQDRPTLVKRVIETLGPRRVDVTANRQRVSQMQRLICPECLDQIIKGVLFLPELKNKSPKDRLRIPQFSPFAQNGNGVSRTSRLQPPPVDPQIWTGLTAKAKQLQDRRRKAQATALVLSVDGEDKTVWQVTDCRRFEYRPPIGSHLLQLRTQEQDLLLATFWLSDAAELAENGCDEFYLQTEGGQQIHCKVRFEQFLESAEVQQIYVSLSYRETRPFRLMFFHLQRLAKRVRTFPQWQILTACIFLILALIGSLVWRNRSQAPAQVSQYSPQPTATAPVPVESPGPAITDHSLESVPTPKSKSHSKPEKSRPRPSAETDKLLAFVFDLNEHPSLAASPRSGVDHTLQPQLKLPAMRVRLNLRLHEGSEAGLYRIGIVDADNRLPVFVSHRSRDGQNLSLELDMRSLNAGRYRLRIQFRNAPPADYLIEVTKP